MAVKPIRSAQSYDAALARASELITMTDAASQDELDVLQAVIERWERSLGDFSAPTPVDAIRFRMTQLGLKPRDLEPYIGTRARVSEVLSGTRQLSLEMMRALSQHLGIPAASLIGTLSGETSAQRGLPSKAAIEKLHSWHRIPADEDIPAFVARTLGPAQHAALLRKTRTDRSNLKSDPAALDAWCAMVVQLSADVKLPRRYAGPSDAKANTLARLSALDNGPSLVRESLRSQGIIFVALEHLPGTYLDGAALMRPADSVPIIAMTLRHDRLDNFWFTLLHEYCHVLYHLNANSPVIMDDLDIHTSAGMEEEADKFAQNTLIPGALWSERVTRELSTDTLCAVAAEAGVHPAVVAGRWQREHRDFRRFSKMLGRGEVRRQLRSQTT